ncbi:MAG TPA: hypothetical protein VK131_05530 [Candidatus Acidoferrales bacterium]|nr:hypothetical protein [Candidatus Acidoferrales bacterium]
MAAHPIYVETEEEIPEVVERLKRTPAEEVPIVIPARSRLGQSRFNFQLLRHYAAQLGKRISIISTEAAVQQMAQETGLEAFGDVEKYGGEVPVVAAPPPPQRTWLNPLRPAPAHARVEVRKPQKLVSKRATEIRPGLLFLYTGAALVAVMGMLALAIYVPSASITLVAQAAPFEQPNIEIQGEPGKPPVRIRTLGDTKQESQGFKSTGVKETPALQAIGNVVWTNSNCEGLSFIIKVGQTVSGGGYSFAVMDGAVVGPPGSQTASVVTPIKAIQPGAGSNLGARTINAFYTPNTPAGRAARDCLTVTNPEATAGGQDAKKEPQMTQSDFDAGRAQLEQELRKEIADDLNNQIQPGEKLSDLISFDAPDFATDHKPGDTVPSFGGTMTLHGEGAYYVEQDVRKALEDTLRKRVPVGSVLTDNKINTEYRVSHESPGGHLTFLGGAHAFIAPQLNYEQIKNKLAGKPTNQARTYLESLPVRSATITEKPINLPFMPMLVSRIDLKYVVERAATKPPPGG